MTQYTNPTGDGYLGIWSTEGYYGEIHIGTFDCVNWRDDDEIVAVQEGPNTIAALEAPTSHEPICELTVVRNTVGPSLQLHSPALRALEDFTPGADVRAYERDAGGLSVVPAAADPFVGGDG